MAGNGGEFLRKTLSVSLDAFKFVRALPALTDRLICQSNHA